ncbi:proline and serine-rich protein 2 [Anoplopoma fimbria]|uniref:proline and serine-rich protein 2 n=1 Tax=Anoplopoma fimbria TaxID=229290 RepID=UPI0023EBB7A7|nr:proline and serine-rich protein 2 [Anoplopoma fimbria]
MEARLQGNTQFYHGVNGGGGRSSRPGEDDTLRYLSQEERECLKFFEKTIESLDESHEPVDGHPTSDPIVSSHLARHHSAKDQDIIYLVRPEPDLVQTKDPIFNPTSPDFNSMMQNPQSHFEMKPRRDMMDSLPSEYNPPLPSGSYGQTDNPSSYHPPGCIPTPVLIAQQIADNKGGGTSNFHPSSFLRSHGHESDKPPNPGGDLPVRHGPPTSAKPSRFPANISVIHGNKEHQNQPVSNVNINERRAQMLANLSGTSNPLLDEETPQPAAEPRAPNTPTRSISFKDPSPDKSRMEALSKLGLNRNRAMSGGMSLLAVAGGTLPNPPTDAEPSAKPLEASAPPATDTTIKLPEANVTPPRQSQIPVDRKPEILQSESLRRYDERNKQLLHLPPAVSQSSYFSPPPLDDKASFPPPSEVTSLELNSYGGKSIVVNPSVSTRSESTTPSSHEPKVLPTAVANPSEFNHYGGKTKVMTPSPAAMTGSDLPDILSSHIDKRQTLPAKSEVLPTELNSYGGKSRSFNPTTGLNRPSDSQARSFKAPAPTPAPRPTRNSYHSGVTIQKPAPRALSPEHRRRSSSQFRPQGITVQFSGRGPMDESRRDALRKLGLWKES